MFGTPEDEPNIIVSMIDDSPKSKLFFAKTGEPQHCEEPKAAHVS